MKFTITSVLIAVCVASLLIFILDRMISINKKYKKIKINWLLLLALFIMLRLLMPFEFYLFKPLNILIDETTLNIVLNDSIIMCLLSLWGIGGVIQVVRYFRKSLEVVQIQKMIEMHSQHSHIKGLIKDFSGRDIEVYITNLISSPMILGLQKKIIIPDIEYSDVELKYVLLHEYNHIQHLDMYIKQICNVIAILYWWLPPVYMLRRQVELCLEMRNDSKIIEDLKLREVLEYANILINFQKRLIERQTNVDQVSVFLIHDNKSVLDLRIHNLLNEDASNSFGYGFIWMMGVFSLITCTLSFSVKQSSEEFIASSTELLTQNQYSVQDILKAEKYANDHFDGFGLEDNDLVLQIDNGGFLIRETLNENELHEVDQNGNVVRTVREAKEIVKGKYLEILKETQV